MGALNESAITVTSRRLGRYIICLHNTRVPFSKTHSFTENMTLIGVGASRGGAYVTRSRIHIRAHTRAFDAEQAPSTKQNAWLAATASRIEIWTRAPVQLGKGHAT